MAELLALILSALIGLVTVWLQLRRRPRDLRDAGPDAERINRPLRFLAVFLPLVGLLTMLQLYMEQRRPLFLAVAGLAALALVVGLASVRGDSGGGRRGPRRGGRRSR